MKAGNVLSFFHIVGTTIVLDIAEISRNAVSFYCDTRNAFLRNSRLPILVKNVKIAIQKIEKDPEQSLVGLLLNLKVIGEFYTVLKTKIDCQYRDTHACSDYTCSFHTPVYRTLDIVPIPP